ncbi:stalk domain-containing protein [Paenibacillus polymyxa]|uniref:stalk domain-containing protein n=1 Tax=Paenibacillus polymyxa TaxID=1406 RepID=UPI002ED035FC|nr:stalk domain-containing protein [Paenibacillus polymyxa]
MKKRIPTFLAGAIFGVAVTLSGVAGASTYLKATLLNTKIIVDGTEAKLNDQPISVNGRSYLPVRDTASAMGYSVASASSSKIELVEGGTNTPSSASSSTTTQATKAETTTAVKQGGKTFNVEQFLKGEKLDSEKIAVAIASGELTINSQDANGDSILHWVIRKNDYATYLVIKKNALNVNLVNSLGNSPLHEAVLDKNGFYIGELTGNTYRANAKVKNAEGKIPLDLVEKGSFTETELKAYML